MSIAYEAHEAAAAAKEQSRRTNRTVTYLAFGVSLMLIAGLTLAVFLLVRGNDIKDVQNNIENRVAQTERAFCAYMEQRTAITTTNDDKLLAAQAAILIRRFGCETKGILQP